MSVKKENTYSENDIIKKLEERLAELEAKNSNNVKINGNDNDRDIMLISLTVGELNLSTEGYGAGTIYSFKEFGEEQLVPYSDVKSIIRNNKTFIEGGRVFINDDDVIKSQRLTKVYEKILGAEDIMNLFKLNKTKFNNIFITMTDAQKENFHNIIIQKLQENQDIDMNIIKVVDDVLKTNIMKEFKDSQDLLENKN